MGSAKDPQLVWVDKHERAPIAPHVLVEDPSKSHPPAAERPEAAFCDNRIVHGDSLPALAALEAEFRQRIKCVYIDPPYNTGATLEHYRDALAHSRWLSMMRDRLERLRELLRPDGVLFVSIDDSEFAYLAVLLDEIFGRQNACGPLIWEKKRKPSFLNANLGIVTEHILVYAKDRRRAPALIGGVTTAGKKFPLNNAGNALRVLAFAAGAVQFDCGDRVFEPQDMSKGKIITRLLDRVEVRGGRNAGMFRLEGEWRYSQATLDAIVREGGTLLISKAPFRPNHVRPGGEPKKLKNLLSIAHGRMSTYEDATEESRALFGPHQAFAYPKPEKLLATLIGSVTAEGDWVLDCFAGSGTTGAVAHKMRRRWILIESGEHCCTHIVPRLRKVIDGADRGGVTDSVGWQCGGGFRYFRVAAADGRPCANSVASSSKSQPGR